MSDPIKSNPVIVFVHPERDGWPENLREKLKSLQFPIGLPDNGADGMDAPSVEGKEYAVLLLDDSAQDIPDRNHKNRFQNAPLLIVAHDGSTYHTAQIIPNQMPEAWGKPFVCETFQHTENPTFSKIQGLISGNVVDVHAFAETRRNKSYFTWLDHLAAICQLKIIDPNAEIDNQLSSLMNKFPRAFENEFKAATNTGEPWKSGLAFIQDRASIFAAEL